MFAQPVGKINELLPLFSFPLITPLAVYFGKEHRKKLYHQHDALHLKESLRRETEDVLFWLTTTFSNSLKRIADNLNKLPNPTKEQTIYLNKIDQEIRNLKKLGEKLKQAIEED